MSDLKQDRPEVGQIIRVMKRCAYYTDTFPEGSLASVVKGRRSIIDKDPEAFWVIFNSDKRKLPRVLCTALDKFELVEG